MEPDKVVTGKTTSQDYIIIVNKRGEPLRGFFFDLLDVGLMVMDPRQLNRKYSRARRQLKQTFYFKLEKKNISGE